MKYLAKTLAAGSILGSALMSSAAMAAEKVGYVDIQGIIQAMPQTAAMQQAIADEFKDQRQEVQTLQEDLKYQVEKLQRESATMSQAQKEELETKILDMRNEFQNKAQPLQQNIQRRSAEEQNKLLVLINDAIQKVAASEKIDMIVERKAVLFAKPELDLSEAVLKQVSQGN